MRGPQGPGRRKWWLGIMMAIAGIGEIPGAGRGEDEVRAMENHLPRTLAGGALHAYLGEQDEAYGALRDGGGEAKE